MVGQKTHLPKGFLIWLRFFRMDMGMKCAKCANPPYKAENQNFSKHRHVAYQNNRI